MIVVRYFDPLSLYPYPQLLYALLHLETLFYLNRSELGRELSVGVRESSEDESVPTSCISDCCRDLSRQLEVDTAF